MFAGLRRRRLWVPTKDGIFVVPETFAPKIAVFVKSFSSKKSSPGVCRNDSLKSFTVSYLINSCGLSSEDALSVSKKVRIESPEKPDAVLELLRKYGFTNTHIPKLVARRPCVLASNPQKTLLPKLEFFCSIGVPLHVLANRLTSYPTILHRNLKNSTIPWYNYLKSIFRSDERVVNVFTRGPMLNSIPSKIAILRERGLPKSSIAFLLAHHLPLLGNGTQTLIRYVDRAAEMGIDRIKVVFVQALLVFSDLSESTLKHKMDVYRRVGWSNADINTAFLKHPLCMKLSEEKIMANMDFLVNKMGLKPVDVAQSPSVLGYSLDKRMKPRCLIARMLNAKGLKKMRSAISLLTISEEKFLKKYIVPYQDDIPQLLDLYRGKLSPDEMGVHQN